MVLPAESLISTGETLAQVQNRLLPIGATINGVTVVNNDTSGAAFHCRRRLRIGWRARARSASMSARRSSSISKTSPTSQYRGISWGIDGGGRGVTVRYRYKF